MAPTCSDMLKTCKWQGHYVQCSKIFSTRKSYMGPCCTFNYQRPLVTVLKYVFQILNVGFSFPITNIHFINLKNRAQQDFNHTIPKLEQPQQVHSHGSDFGLTILIDNQLNDYAFTMNSYTGTNVLIYDAYDYPDQTAGAVAEKVVLPEQEVYFTLHPTPIEGSKSMRSFAISSRNCVFKDEINLVFSK